ncbi:MAG: rhodanese-like domain-containing protein [Bradymonadaceae bacterium]|nr:rhodanese-like domain-containing protein [Lujinxingiaceae bacterium]
MKELTYPEFAQQRTAQNFRLIDVREQDEYDDVHVQGAEHFALSRIRDGELPEQDSRPIALICRSGGRSAMAAQMLEAKGFAETTNIAGGTLSAIEASPEHVERAKR